MALISLHSVSFSYSGPDLLRDVTFHLEEGERVCVIGRNGAGKSTLLQLVQGDISPVKGMIETSEGLRIGCLPQIVPDDLSGSVFEIVARGLGSAGDVIVELESGHHLTDVADHARMAKLREQLGETSEWDLIHRIERVIHNCRLQPGDLVAPMSAGMKRRVLLARAFVQDPHVLLLDEPTNHLDIPTIQWLEETLLASKMTLVFITHDRMLVEKLATRIVEIDRGSLHNWACDYVTYVQRRDQLLTSQTRQKVRMDRKLDEETAWLHRGVKARGTRNEGRVKALKQLREERKAWRDLTGSVRMRIQEAQKSGRVVIDVDNVSFAYSEELVIRNFSATILRGDRIGIMGPNGFGKSTLLRLMLGELEPQSGTVNFGTKLAIAYFDQLRLQLDPEMSVLDSIAGGLREVTIGGRSRHIYSYLKDFLFDPADAGAPVKTLSGGERNRLLLARLFTKESNVLVMDEPTNDLDADTLDILENQLMEYNGTVLVVSHDRTFLNNVVSATLVFEDTGRIQEYAGGYDDWLLQRRKTTDLPDNGSDKPGSEADRRRMKSEHTSRTTKSEHAPKSSRSEHEARSSRSEHEARSSRSEHEARSQKTDEHTRPKKLSYHLVRELENLPGEIDMLETTIREIYAEMSEPDFYLNSPETIRDIEKKLKTAEEQLDEKIARWSELDDYDGQN